MVVATAGTSEFATLLGVPRRRRFEALRQQLETERQSFISHWRELADYILPRRPRFVVSDANRGDRRSAKIQDGTATLAARVLAGGMMGGITSPSRPWFKLTVSDPDLAEDRSVQKWLDVVTRRMREVFIRSNVYNSLSVLYKDLATFATSAMSVEEDFENVIHTRVYPIGSYMASANRKGRVDTFLYEHRMTVRQIVESFALDPFDPSSMDFSRVSQQVRRFWENGQVEAWVDVARVVTPNPQWDPRKAESRFKRYLSCTWERGFSMELGAGSYLLPDEADKCLAVSGFDRFPVLVPRWEVTGEDVYGSDCPGMTALGDIKQLQLGEKRAMQAIEKMVNPPMVGPPHLRNARASILPGDITYLDVREGMQGFRPIHEVQPRIQELEAKQSQKRDLINRAFHLDLFFMLAASDKRERRTAREVQELHEEKLIQLGPVLERMSLELHDPLIEHAFDFMIRQGLVPPAPPALSGRRLKVEYISIMAQAQKFVGLGGMERLLNFVATAMQLSQGAVADKINWDEYVEEYSDTAGAPPTILRSEEEVLEIRQARAQLQSLQAEVGALREAAASAKDLSKADTSKDNLLTRLSGAAQGQG